MSDDPIKYVFTSPWDGGTGHGELQEIASRFGVKEQAEILTLSAGEPWTQRLGESARAWMGAGLEDKDVLRIPRGDAEWPLDHGASWAEWPINDGDTVQMIVDDLKGGSPIGLLIPGWAPPNDVGDSHSSVADRPGVSLVSFIWYYYANAALRADTLRASGQGVEADQLATFPNLTLNTSTAKTIWVPVIPPVRSTIAVAPSSVLQPLTGATVDVKPSDKFRVLTELLRNIELQLDGIHANRCTLAGVLSEGEAVLTNLAHLRRSMVATAEGWKNAAAAAPGFYSNPYARQDAPGATERRAAAIARLDDLIALATTKIRSPVDSNGRPIPIWMTRDLIPRPRKEPPNFPKNFEDDIQHATTAVQGLIGGQGDTGLMSLVVELCPFMHDAPVRTRSKMQVTLLDYVCGLAAGVAAALANSTDSKELEFVRGIATAAQTGVKNPGQDCANLIEYAAACTNGFATGDRVEFPGTSAPMQVLGVLQAISLHKQIQALSPGVDTSGARITATAAAKLAANTALNATIAKIRPLLIAAGVVDEQPLPTGIAAKIKAASDVHEGTKSSFEDLVRALKTANYGEAKLKAFAGGLLAPFAEEKEPAFAKFVPKGMRGCVPLLGPLFDVAQAESEIAEIGTKAALTVPSVIKTGADALKATGEVVASTLEGAKALKLFATGPSGELLAFGKAAEVTIKALGRASFVLGAVSESVEVYDAWREKDRIGEFAHVAGAAGYVCLFAASVGGAPVLVVVGTSLLVGDVVLTKGRILTELLKGETAKLYEAVIPTPDEEKVPEGERKTKANKDREAAELFAKWDRVLDFKVPVGHLRAAFRNDDFANVPFPNRFRLSDGS